MNQREFTQASTIKVLCLVGLGALALMYGAHRIRGASAARGWRLALDRPMNGKYEDFAFPDSTNGWLVSSHGDILHTGDGGRTWAVQTSKRGSLRSVDFVDHTTGFAGTLSGVLLGTTDGGATWTDITSTLPRKAKGFCGMTHVGKQVHLVGRYFGGAADYFFSPDAGKTWRASDLSAQAQGLVDVAFLDESVGFIGGMAKSGPPGAGPAVILKTTDGGQSWRRVFEHNGGRGFAWKIFPISPKLIYASLQSQDGIYRIAKSTDGGEQWETLTVVTGRRQGPAVQGIGFIDDSTGWVGGFFEGMYATTDGGLTWRPVPIGGRAINRFARVGSALFTAGSRGILRYERVGH